MRVSFSQPQTQALVSLLCTVGSHSIDVRQFYPDGYVLVTVWRNGDPTVWAIYTDGFTQEVGSIPVESASDPAAVHVIPSEGGGHRKGAAS